MQCPVCGAELTEILIVHHYSLDYSEEQEKWVKNDNGAYYNCGNCLEELEFSAIEDILKQVGEL